MSRTINLPQAEPNPNVRFLSQYHRQVTTGITGTALTLEEAYIDGAELVVKNGSVLTPTTDYTMAGTTLTLGVAAISGDVFLIRGLFRQQ